MAGEGTALQQQLWSTCRSFPFLIKLHSEVGRGKTYWYTLLGHKLMMRWSCGTRIVQKKRKNQEVTLKQADNSTTADEQTEK